MKKAGMVAVLAGLLMMPMGSAWSQEAVAPDAMVEQEVVLQQGMPLKTELMTEINSESTRPGDELEFKLTASIIVDEKIIIPQNTVFKGILVDFSRESLLRNNYNIVVDITKMITPFGKEYAMKAHPDFNQYKEKPSKSFFIKLGFKKHNSDTLIDEMNTRKKSKKTEQPLIIPAGENVDVVLDEEIKMDFR